MRRNYVLIFLSAAALAVALASYFVLFTYAAQNYISTEKILRIGGIGVAIAVADTPQEREQGLSGTTALSDSEGMFFVFERDDQHSFWMKDMHYPIDIIWISASKSVVYIETGVAPDTFPHSFTPPTPARYVLEVPAGFSEKHGIAVGERVEF
jgi:uncharacterized protein